MNMRERIIVILCLVILSGNMVLAQVPAITAISPDTGAIGTTVTLTGSNFNETAANNLVYFGGIQATVTSATATSLTVEVPEGASSDYIYVNVGGLIGQSLSRFTVTFESDGYIGNSPKSFADVEAFVTGDGAWALDMGDLDGDGLTDVVTGNWDAQNYSVFVNNSSGPGDISFATRVDFASNAYVNEIKLKDLDGDGLLDIVAVTEDDGGNTYLEVLRNTTSAAGAVSFTMDANIPVDGYNYVLDALDLNEDGKIDVAVLDMDNAQVSIFENSSTTGSISFEDDVDFAIDSDAYDIDYGDINGDGKPDIVTLDGTTKSISVLENTSSAGSISFAAKVDFAVNADINCLEVGDLNADGLPDIVVKNANNIFIFKNESSTSTIALSTPDQIGISSQYGFGLSVDGDLNGDGKPDIIFKSVLSQVGVLKNTSSGSAISFESAVLYTTGSSHDSKIFTAGDLDGDGEPDLVGTAYYYFSSEYELAVFRNLRSDDDITAFSFAEQTAPATIDSDAYTIEVNVDGVLDLTDLVATFELPQDASVSISGTAQTSGVTSNDFSDPVTYTITAEDGSTSQDWTVTVILECVLDETDLTEEVCGSYDFDGEILKASGTYVRAYTNVLGCDSTVTVELTVHPQEFYENVYAVDSYEFDGVSLTTSGQYQYGPFTSTETGCDSTFLLNLTIEPDTYDDQDYLQFRVTSTDFPILTELGRSHIEDVDGDGEKDVFFIGKTKDDIIAALYINNADGTYTEKTDHGIQGLKVGGRNSLFTDLDGDDNLDFLVIGRLNNSNFTKLYINDGAGNFSEKEDHGLPGLGKNVYTSFLDSADVDGDNDIDLVISKTDPYNSYEPEIWLNNGDGSFALSTANDFPSTDASGASFADFDSDGDQDLVLSGYGLENRIWLNDGTGIFTPNLDKSLASLWYHGLVIFDMDGDGDLDIFDSGTRDYSNKYTAVYFNNGDGTFTHDDSSDIPRMEGNLNGYGTNSKAADFDNDGDLDLIIEGQYRYAGGPAMVDYMDVWINNGFGHFKPLKTQALNYLYPDDKYPLLDEYGYANYTYINALSVFDFDRDGRLDILVSGTEIWDANDEIAYEEVTRIMYNSSLSSNLVVESCDSYDFDGSTLTSTGNYQGMYTDESGTSYPVNLDLTILESDEVDVGMEACGSFEFGTQLITISGNYTELFMNQAGCDSTVNLSIGILEAPEVSIEVNGVVLFANDISGATYQWYDCDTETEIDGEDKRQLTPPTTGNYYVVLNDGVCSATSECVFFDWVLAADNAVEREAQVYPTLTNGDFTLDLRQMHRDVEVRIMSLDGHVIQSNHYDSFSKGSFNISETTGVYLVQVSAAGEPINTQRIIKK